MAIAPHFTSYLGADTEKEDGQVYIGCGLAVNCDRNDKRARENCECILLVTNITSMLVKEEVKKKKANGQERIGKHTLERLGCTLLLKNIPFFVCVVN